ncbi:MAG: hypothetical protein EA381_06885 [Planctomycetaceae bacterium]|nr:MAG: hypothetical protein EA381_06885 [Planctomycetaceae bacterium]
MLLIVIVAFIATTAFYRQAKLVGVHPGKAASIPFVTAGILLAVAYVTSLALTHIAVAVGASGITLTSIMIILRRFTQIWWEGIGLKKWVAPFARHACEFFSVPPCLRENPESWRTGGSTRGPEIVRTYFSSSLGFWRSNLVDGLTFENFTTKLGA